MTAVLRALLAGWTALALGGGCVAAPRERPPAPAAVERSAFPATAPADRASRAASAAAAALAPFPPPGSDEGKADLAVVLWLQRTRSAADVARAQGERELGLDTFADALGRAFDAAAHPRTRALLRDAGERTRRAVGEAKRRFRRPRPYDADTRVTPAIEREGSFSYPSGHAARGVVLARLLAELAPDRRGPLREVGLRVGYDRVVGGVHYPSDVTAAQRLGDEIADALLADGDVRRALEEVRAAEWRGSIEPAAPSLEGAARQR